MPSYVIDTILTKDNTHILHETECPYAPDKNHSIEFGFFTECSSALRYIRIKNQSSNVSGCKYCCRSCRNKI